MSLPLRINKSLKILFVYSQEREDKNRRNKLEKHLSGIILQGVGMKWYKHEIEGGQENIYELNKADIMVMLISPNLIHLIENDASWKEVTSQARIRHDAKKAIMIPVVLHSIHGWQNKPYFRDIQALPKSGEGLDSKRDFEKVAQGIEERVNELIDYKQKLQEYANVVYEKFQQEYPLSLEDGESLKLLRKDLNISEKDAIQIERTSSQAMEEKIAQKTQQFVEQKNVNKWISIASSVIFISILLFIFNSCFGSFEKKSPEELFQDGIEAAKREDWSQAIENYTQAIQGDSNKAIYYTKRGNAYYIEKEWQKAIEDYTQAIQRDSTNTEAYLKRSEIFSNLSNRQAAIKDLQQAAYIYKKQGKNNDYQKTLNKLKKLQR